MFLLCFIRMDHHSCFISWPMNLRLSLHGRLFKMKIANRKVGNNRKTNLLGQNGVETNILDASDKPGFSMNSLASCVEPGLSSLLRHPSHSSYPLHPKFSCGILDNLHTQLQKSFITEKFCLLKLTDPWEQSLFSYPVKCLICKLGSRARCPLWSPSINSL